MTTTTAINLNQLNISQHAKTDRVDRLSNCIATVGIGKVVFICKSDRATDPTDYVVNCVTSTGLVLVISLTKNLLITGYLGTIPRVMGLYKSRGIQKMPEYLFQTIRKNERRYSFLY